jgi:ribose transport system substrate-binding protein
MQAGRTRPQSWRTVLRCLAMAMGFTSTVLAAAAQDGPQGLTKRTVLPAFDPNAPVCHPPKDRTRVLAFVAENERGFLQGVDHGLRLAAGDRKLEYRKTSAENDARQAIGQVQALLDDKVGAVVATSPDPAALAPILQKVIWSGAFVGTIVPPPATLILNAPQYETGKVLTDAAISYINTRLGGKATAVLLTQDTMEYLAPRFEAMRDGLGAIPGVTIIADIAPKPVSKEGGFAVMNKILLANPKIDVVLGADAVVLGALAALRAAGKDRPDQFLGGIDGEPEGIAEIRKGDSPFKASVALSSAVFGYAMGQFAADWLEGKSIPQAMDILPIAITGQNITTYEADLVDPAAVFKDEIRRSLYLKTYGNICYDTRDQYLNFPWSSEYRP